MHINKNGRIGEEYIGKNQPTTFDLNSGKVEFSGWIYTENDVHFNIGINSEIEHNVKFDKDIVGDKKWHHLTFPINNRDRNMKVYVDGIRMIYFPKWMRLNWLTNLIWKIKYQIVWRKARVKLFRGKDEKK